MTAAIYKVKTLIILSALLLWAGAAAVCMFSYSVLKRDALLKSARSIAWREARIPAKRGQILDRDGVILAKDQFRSDLLLESWPKHSGRAKKLLALLREEFPGFDITPDEQVFPVQLKEHLTAEDIRRYNHFFRRFPEVRVYGSFERWCLPELREVIGTTALNDRQEAVGVSGLEQQHDLTLSGKPGRLTVMLDRNGIWVRDTLRVTRQPENGHDLKLNLTKAELEAGQ